MLRGYIGSGELCVHGSDIVCVVCCAFLWMERRFMWLFVVTEQGHEVLWDVVCNRIFVTENEDK